MITRLVDRYFVGQSYTYKIDSMFDLYLGLSPLIWKVSIILLSGVFIVGLLLALFATKYQKRKEVEIQIEGEILKLRLKAYERINVFLGRL